MQIHTINPLLDEINNFFSAVMNIYTQLPKDLNEEIKTMQAFLRSYDQKQLFLIQNFVRRLETKADKMRSVNNKKRGQKHQKTQPDYDDNNNNNDSSDNLYYNNRVVVNYGQQQQNNNKENEFNSINNAYINNNNMSNNNNIIKITNNINNIHHNHHYDNNNKYNLHHQDQDHHYLYNNISQLTSLDGNKNHVVQKMHDNDNNVNNNSNMLTEQLMLDRNDNDKYRGIFNRYSSSLQLRNIYQERDNSHTNKDNNDNNKIYSSSSLSCLSQENVNCSIQSLSNNLTNNLSNNLSNNNNNNNSNVFQQDHFANIYLQQQQVQYNENKQNEQNKQNIQTNNRDQNQNQHLTLLITKMKLNIFELNKMLLTNDKQILPILRQCLDDSLLFKNNNSNSNNSCLGLHKQQQ